MSHELDSMADLARRIADATGMGIAQAMSTYNFQAALHRQTAERMNAEFEAYMKRLEEAQKSGAGCKISVAFGNGRA